MVLFIALASPSIVACSGAGGSDAGSGGGPSRPNLVFIVLDDLDQLTMPYWKAMPKTKERLADKGLVFTNAFVTSPECCPSRASLLTGNYPHTTRVYDSTEPDGGYQTFASNGAEKDTLATRLHAEGYRTAFIGKYLNGYEEESSAVPPGWDEWFGLGPGFSKGYRFGVNHNGSKESFGSKPEDYLTDVLAAQADAEVDRNESNDDRPFLLALWPSAPHAEIAAAPRDADNPFARAVPPRRPNFDEADVSDKPTWLREGIRSMTPRDVTDLTTRYRMMMGSLYAVDDMIDRLITKLEADDELDNTVFAFTSDNGYNFGAHRLPHKMVPYEESIRVPLVVAGRGVRPGLEDRLVLNNDLTPTLLDLAGLAVDDLDGSSLVPLLRGRAVAWRRDFLIEYHGTYHRLISIETLDDVRRFAPTRRRTPATETPLAFVPTFRAVRTDRWLYIQWYAGDEHEYELYDLRKDPYQLTNLLGTPDGMRRHADTAATLQARLEELAGCSGRTCRP